jgi:hypothetical protein
VRTREKSAEGIVTGFQAKLVRHSNVERRSEQIGQAARGLSKARTYVEEGTFDRFFVNTGRRYGGNCWTEPTNRYRFDG